MKPKSNMMKIVLKEKGYDFFVEVKCDKFDLVAFNTQTRQILFVKHIAGGKSKNLADDLLNEFKWLTDEWMGGYFINTL